MKNTYITKLAAILAIPAMAIAVVSCGDPDMPTPTPATTAPTTSGNIRFINASPGAPALSFFVNNVASSANVGYLDITTYQKTPVGQAVVRGNAATGEIGGTLGKNPILYRASTTTQNNFSFNDNAYYTFIVTDTLDRPKPTVLNGTNPGGPQFLALSDNLSAPAAGKAKVRIIDVATGVSSVYATTAEGEDFSTFNVNGDKRPGIAYRAATSFVAVDAGTTHLELRTGENDGPVISSGDFEFTEGKIYTIILTGKAFKETDPEKVPLELLVIEQ